MNEHADALGQYAVRFDRFHSTLGMNAIPCQRFVGCDMEPMEFAGNAQARLVGAEKWRRAQAIGDLGV